MSDQRKKSPGDHKSRGSAQEHNSSCSSAEGGQRTVVVDLDNTLLLHDTLHEQLVRLLFQPKLVPGLLMSFFGGKASIKAYCADHIMLNTHALQVCKEVTAFIERERAAGSRIVLCTAADRRVADSIAQAIGGFDEVIATEDGLNLKGTEKAKLLAERFPDGFIYAGDHSADLPVWEQAEGIVLVGTSVKTSKRARQLGKPIVDQLRIMPEKRTFRVWSKAMRMHHWSKNLLMFVPIILAHEWLNTDLFARVFIGFLLLLAMTSASYFINDLADLDADRMHATKRNRPIASGALPLFQAVLFPTLVIPVVLVTALDLNQQFAAALAAYLAITLAYSFGLKRIPLLDTFVIGILFTTRLVMGSAFVAQALPVWLLTFSMFFFFSLAMAKRHVEVLRAQIIGGDSLKSRGYKPDDWPLTLTLGVSAGLGSLIILVLYMVEEAFRVVGYSRPVFLWVISLILAAWIGRVWLLTHRGEMNDDPVTFALRDRPSIGIALAMAVCFLIAL